MCLRSWIYLLMTLCLRSCVNKDINTPKSARNPAKWPAMWCFGRVRCKSERDARLYLSRWAWIFDCNCSGVAKPWVARSRISKTSHNPIVLSISSTKRHNGRTHTRKHNLKIRYRFKHAEPEPLTVHSPPTGFSNSLCGGLRWRGQRQSSKNDFDMMAK